MSDLNLRSDTVDVDAIMRQIRQRIKEKRGADYTEAEVRELASVKLERFLDPRAVRTDLIQHYRRLRPPVPLPDLPAPPERYGFEDETIYESHRGPLRFVRRLLNPLLKLFFNPNPIIRVLHLQSRLNDFFIGTYEKQFEFVAHKFKTRDELDGLNYEVMSNLVLEVTKLGIEVKNLRMRLESLSARLDFDERRARALEGVVQYRPEAFRAPTPEREGADEEQPEGDGGMRSGKRRRRRRGRRRSGGGLEDGGGTASTAPADGEASSADGASPEPGPPQAPADVPPQDRSASEPDES